MIKNILFDMGNVLLQFSPKDILEAAGVPEEDRPLLMREVFKSKDWIRLDRGSVTDEEGVAAMCARLPERLHKYVPLLVSGWDVRAGEISGMRELVRELSEKGYGLYLLTNAALRHHEYWKSLPVSRYFGNHVMLSADWKLLKPCHEFYEKTFELFNLEPGECVFIDDSPSNCEAAEELGLASIVFHGEEYLREEFKRMGIL